MSLLNVEAFHILARDNVSGNCTKDTCPASDSIYGYAPNFGFNVTFVGIFAVSGIVFYHQSFLWKNWRFFGFAMALGCLMESGGYVGRLLLHNNPFSDIGFKLNIVLLTVAPALLSAGLYVTLKRITLVFGSRLYSDHACIRITLVFGSHLSRLPPSMYVYIFMSSDAVSILLQGAGGAISAVATEQTLLNQGVDIMIAGLAFQVFTLLVFFCLCAEYGIRCLRNPNKLRPGRRQLAASAKFQLFLGAVTISFLCIFTRCCYRIGELSGGWGNSIMRNEADFVILDSEMCTIAAVVLNVFHPGMFFKEPYHATIADEKIDSSTSEGRSDGICRLCRAIGR